MFSNDRRTKIPHTIFLNKHEKGQNYEYRKNIASAFFEVYDKKNQSDDEKSITNRFHSLQIFRIDICFWTSDQDSLRRGSVFTAFLLTGMAMLLELFIDTDA